VPGFLLRALNGPTGHRERPSEVPATVGSRFYDGTAWSLGNPVSPLQDVQSFLYPLDSTPSMDFLLPAGGGGVGGNACKINGGGSAGAGKFAVSLHATAPPTGQIAYRDSTTDFNSKTIGSIRCNGSAATITGTGFNRNDQVSFQASVTDGTPDTFSVTLTPGGARGGTVTKGNVHVR
jgi:hypothetical protein